jgi:hypothetical protein
MQQYKGEIFTMPNIDVELNSADSATLHALGAKYGMYRKFNSEDYTNIRDELAKASNLNGATGGSLEILVASGCIACEQREKPRGPLYQLTDKAESMFPDVFPHGYLGKKRDTVQEMKQMQGKYSIGQVRMRLDSADSGELFHTVRGESARIAYRNLTVVQILWKEWLDSAFRMLREQGQVRDNFMNFMRGEEGRQAGIRISRGEHHSLNGIGGPKLPPEIKQEIASHLGWDSLPTLLQNLQIQAGDLAQRVVATGCLEAALEPQRLVPRFFAAKTEEQKDRDRYIHSDMQLFKLATLHYIAANSKGNIEEESPTARWYLECSRVGDELLEGRLPPTASKIVNRGLQAADVQRQQPVQLSLVDLAPQDDEYPALMDELTLAASYLDKEELDAFERFHKYCEGSGYWKTSREYRPVSAVCSYAAGLRIGGRRHESQLAPVEQTYNPGRERAVNDARLQRLAL